MLCLPAAAYLMFLHGNGANNTHPHRTALHSYNRLYSVTAQSLEELKPQYEATLLAMVKSLSVPATKF